MDANPFARWQSAYALTGSMVWTVRPLTLCHCREPQIGVHWTRLDLTRLGWKRLGLETELAVRTGDDRHAVRVRRLVPAIAEHMAPDGILKGAGGGDGGLFAGITARYLALAATALPGDSGADTAARNTARDIVLASAGAAWDNRQDVDGLPLFSAFWDRTAEVPRTGAEAGKFVEGAVTESAAPERDLSVQVSGWMLMEAAHVVAQHQAAQAN